MAFLFRAIPALFGIEVQVVIDLIGMWSKRDELGVIIGPIVEYVVVMYILGQMVLGLAVLENGLWLSSKRFD